MCVGIRYLPHSVRFGQLLCYRCTQRHCQYSVQVYNESVDRKKQHRSGINMIP